MMGPGITLAMGGVPASILSRTAAEGLERARAQTRFLAGCGLAEPAAADRAESGLSSNAAGNLLIAKVIELRGYGRCRGGRLRTGAIGLTVSLYHTVAGPAEHHVMYVGTRAAARNRVDPVAERIEIRAA